jgi:hypothetical protein
MVAGNNVVHVGVCRLAGPALGVPALRELLGSRKQLCEYRLAGYTRDPVLFLPLGTSIS